MNNNTAFALVAA